MKAQWRGNGICLSLVCFVVLVASMGGACSNVEIWNPNYATAAGVKYYQEVFIPALKTAHPDITLEVLNLNFNVYYDRVALAAATGMLPDVNIPFERFILPGWMRPLDDLIAKWNIGNKIMPLLKGAVYKGKTYGVSFGLSPIGTGINNRLFMEGGLDPGNPPGNWDDLLRMARKLTRKNSEGKIEQYGVRFLIPDYVRSIGDFMIQNGADILDKDGNAAFNSPAAVEALKYLEQFASILAPGMQAPALTKGITAIDMYTSVSDFDVLVKNSDPMLADLTISTKAIGPKRKFIQGRQLLLGIHEGTNDVEAAWNVIKFHIEDPTINKTLNEVTGYIPMHRSLYTPALTKDRPWLIKFGEIVSKYEMIDPWGPINTAFHPKSGDLRAVLQNHLTKWSQGQVPATTALNNAAAEWNVINAESGYPLR